MESYTEVIEGIEAQLRARVSVLRIRPALVERFTQAQLRQLYAAGPQVVSLNSQPSKAELAAALVEQVTCALDRERAITEMSAAHERIGDLLRALGVASEAVDEARIALVSEAELLVSRRLELSFQAGGRLPGTEAMLEERGLDHLCR